ncbi:DUF1569 domain-containing protein [Polaribacter ponticola]|uniref:DUF1569 domain-containing protein n=1 Tax=Polaribacter ponticola TaxID=2978475 RepID=A0ABT5S5W6_9FLAO|nr:DUF1569 domain-containing protein [Polaribacter sp. MSW5]MDD7913494.1 DUF1569 domain-containing protein [Polaribacter sp. MSW5]
MLNKELELINSYLKYLDVGNQEISKGSVGWHLDHSLKVINNVSVALIKSDVRDYNSKFNLLRLITFTIGFFPRGKAKSPKRVLPPEEISIGDVKNQLDLATKNLKLITTLKDHQHFIHPLFKQLNKKQTIKFLRLHTNHHLKIIRDILNK